MHFHYLMDVGGGLVQPARSFEEHVDAALGHAGRRCRGIERARRFTEAFIRPSGPGRPSTPRFANAIEAAAAQPAPAPAGAPPAALAARPCSCPGSATRSSAPHAAVAEGERLQGPPLPSQFQAAGVPEDSPVRGRAPRAHRRRGTAGAAPAHRREPDPEAEPAARSGQEPRLPRCRRGRGDPGAGDDARAPGPSDHRRSLAHGNGIRSCSTGYRSWRGRRPTAACTTISSSSSRAAARRRGIGTSHPTTTTSCRSTAPTSSASATRRASTSSEGRLKHVDVGDFDQEIIERVKRARGLGDAKLLHPSLMYNLFSVFWRQQAPMTLVEAFTRLQIRCPSCRSATWRRSCRASTSPRSSTRTRRCQTAPRNRAFIADGRWPISRGTTDVVLLNTAQRYDDHADFAPIQARPAAHRRAPDDARDEPRGADAHHRRRRRRSSAPTAGSRIWRRSWHRHGGVLFASRRVPVRPPGGRQARLLQPQAPDSFVPLDVKRRGRGPARRRQAERPLPDGAPSTDEVERDRR